MSLKLLRSIKEDFLLWLDRDKFRKHLDEIYKNFSEEEKEAPPTYFIGNLGKCKYLIIGLNPAFNKVTKWEICRLRILRESKNIPKKVRFESYYHFYTNFFFNVAEELLPKKISLKYYDNLAYFFKGYENLNYDINDREDKIRFYKEFLHEKVVNMDFIPYHRKKWEVPEKSSTINKHINILREIIDITKPILIIINGSSLEKLLLKNKLVPAQSFKEIKQFSFKGKYKAKFSRNGILKYPTLSIYFSSRFWKINELEDLGKLIHKKMGKSKKNIYLGSRIPDIK